MLKIQTPPFASVGTQPFLDRRKSLLIANEWTPAADGETFATRDPATGTIIAEVLRARSTDVDRAVAAARAALIGGPWPAMTPGGRARLMLKLAALMEDDIDTLAELETLDQGKPLAVGRWAEIPGAIEQFRYFAGVAGTIAGDTIPTSIDYQPAGKRVFAYTRKQPVGVVAAIVPWNSPLVLTAMKLAPALAAGCTIVLKPAEDTPLTALRLGELIVAAGFPPGVVNIVTGYGHEAGAALAGHMDVDKVAFTGSTTTGRAIVEAAARSNLKKVSLELGGKSPVIILPDADIDAAIAGAANSIFFNGGQVCVAGSRLYAHAGIFDRVAEGVAAYAAALTLGHGLDPATQLGPIVSRRQADRIADYIDQGRGAGATVLTGGGQVGDSGCFIEPTVLTDVTPDMAVVREEIFGPVLVVSRFDDLDEVVMRANDSIYGLAAGIWTNDLGAAHRLAADLQAGTIWVNTHLMYDASLPIGGLKQSGWGRDSGRQAVENYLDTKTVCCVI